MTASCPPVRRCRQHRLEVLAEALERVVAAGRRIAAAVSALGRRPPPGVRAHGRPGSPAPRTGSARSSRGPGRWSARPRGRTPRRAARSRRRIGPSAPAPPSGGGSSSTRGRGRSCASGGRCSAIPAATPAAAADRVSATSSRSFGAACRLVAGVTGRLPSTCTLPRPTGVGCAGSVTTSLRSERTCQ